MLFFWTSSCKAQLFSTFLIIIIRRIVSWASNQYIRMVSEGSRDTDGTILSLNHLFLDDFLSKCGYAAILNFQLTLLINNKNVCRLLKSMSHQSQSCSWLPCVVFMNVFTLKPPVLSLYVSSWGRLALSGDWLSHHVWFVCLLSERGDKKRHPPECRIYQDRLKDCFSSFSETLSNDVNTNWLCYKVQPVLCLYSSAKSAYMLFLWLICAKQLYILSCWSSLLRPCCTWEKCRRKSLHVPPSEQAIVH